MLKEAEFPEKKIREFLERAEADFYSAVSAWAAWEAFNSFPNAAKRIETRTLINGTLETTTARVLQHHLFSTTLLSVSRMLDGWGIPGKPSNRLSLPVLYKFLKEGQIFERLLKEASSTGNIRRTMVSAEVTIAYSEKMERWFGPKIGTHRNLSDIHPKLKKLRDESLAHSLEQPTIPGVTPFFVRDALVLCGITIRMLYLALLGHNWNPRYYWMIYFKSADKFWRTHTEGLRAAHSKPDSKVAM